ncbi:MAG: protein kinase [Bryobacteraceae bacterium]
MRLSTGAILGPYAISNALGAGGMGEVYRAHDTRLGRDVAIKLLSPSNSGDPASRERFIREARTACRLNHPNIVTIYDIGEWGDDLFIVMEYVTGKTLAQTLDENPLTLSQVVHLGVQIASALEKAHASGIIHRDLKPANILITEDGTAKILDFGIAKVTAALPTLRADEPTLVAARDVATRSGMILGTPAYMSPEQAEGKPVDARSDMFAFGVVLYECVARQLPFRGTTAGAVIASILRDEPTPLRELIPGLPASVESVIHRCLRKEVGQRFATMSDAREALASGAAAPGTDANTLVPSIAVLAFANLSGDASNDYFGAGLAEEIISALGRLKDLRVIARTSAFAFRADQHSAKEIGEKLRVATVLEGSIRKAGNRVRVTAQLRRTSDEQQLWAERYDGDLSDIFEVQETIARSIVEALRVQLAAAHVGPLVKRGTSNLEAFECYLRGRFHYSRLTPTDMNLAVDFQKRALALDPDYPDPYADLAGYQLAAAMFGLAPSLPVYASAKALIEKCLALDPLHALAHTFYGRFLVQYEYRWVDAEAHFRRGIELNPATPLARNYFATEFLCALGRTDEALDQMTRAAQLDPLSPLHRFGLSMVHTHRRDYDAALRYAEEALELNPHFWMALWLKGMALSALGDAEGAIPVLQLARSIGPRMSWVAGTLAGVYAHSGRRGEAEALIEEWHQVRAAGYAQRFTLGTIHANLGQTDEAIECFEAALAEKEPTLGVAMLRIDNYVADAGGMIQHPRWQELLGRIRG